MSCVNSNTCSECQHWDWVADVYGDFPEENCGTCKKNGDVTYSDDEACDDFCASNKNTKFMNKKSSKSGKSGNVNYGYVKNKKRQRNNELDDWN